MPTRKKGDGKSPNLDGIEQKNFEYIYKSLKEQQCGENKKCLRHPEFKKKHKISNSKAQTL